MQPCVKAMFKQTNHKHSKFVLTQLELVKVTHGLKMAQSALVDLGSDAAAVCLADPNRKAVLGVEKARRETGPLLDTMASWIATNAPTQDLPGLSGEDLADIDVSKIDLETCFFGLPMEKIHLNSFDTELFTDSVSFICAQMIQQLEEGKVVLTELARLGMPETSWKRDLSNDASGETVLETSASLLKVQGKTLRNELESYSKDRGWIAYIHTYIHTYRHADMQTYRHTYIHTYSYRQTNIYTYKRLHIYIYTYLHIYIFTYIHVYINTYLSYIHIYICTFIHIYLHTSYVHIYIFDSFDE